MPTNWQNERARRRWFAVTMWLVFLASLGAAATVGHFKARSLIIQLGPVKEVGAIRLQVPAGWIDDEESNDKLTMREGRKMGTRVT